MDYLLAVLAALLLGAGFVLQQDVAEHAPKAHFLRLRLLTGLLRQPRWLAGVGTMVTGQLLSAWVIGHMALTLAEPLLATNLLFALVLAGLVSKQPLYRSEVTGALILMAGVTVLSVTRTVHGPQVSVGRPAYWPYAGAVIAVIAYTFAHLGRRRSGNLRATLTGASAGMVFGVQDALTRQTVGLLIGRHLVTLLTSWPGYCLIGVGLIGLWLMENAFSAAPLHASLPAITAAEPVAGIAMGVAVFGDSVNASPGMIATQLAGLAALLTGVILVSRAPALAGVRGMPRLRNPSGGGCPPAAPPPGKPPSPDGQPPAAEPPHEPFEAEPGGQPNP